MSKKAWISLLVTVLLIAGITGAGLGAARHYVPPETKDSGSTDASSSEDDSSASEDTSGETEKEEEPETSGSEMETSGSEMEESDSETEESGASENTDGTEDEASGDGSEDLSLLRLIFLGDSRTVGLYCSQAYSREEAEAHYFYHIGEEMYASLGPVTYVAHGGTGYDWLSYYAFARAVTWDDEAPAYVFWFGINDLQNVESYVSYINNVVVPYGRPVFYLTVGPSREDAEEGFGDEQIRAFNGRLTEALSPEVTVIDVYAFLQEGLASGEFALADSLHYTYDTYKAVYEYVLVRIGEQLK